MTHSFQVTFDAADPGALARFWAEALGYKLQDPPSGHDSWESWLASMNIPKEKWNDASAIVDPEGKGARIFFQRVPEGKTAKNRVHLDVNVGGPMGTPDDVRRAAVEASIERLTALGATQLYAKDERGEHWVTFADPEGNEFCVQ